jgi:hypothetical protein
MKTTHIFEILRVLGAFEVILQTNLKGSKDSKVLQLLFSEETLPDGAGGINRLYVSKAADLLPKIE